MIAGWTGRDVAALNHHIEELKAIGVQPPSQGAALLSRRRQPADAGRHASRCWATIRSGEVEPVLVGAADRLWVTVGADHTDRKVESYGVAVSKQICAKLIGRTAGASRRSSRTGTG